MWLDQNSAIAQKSPATGASENTAPFSRPAPRDQALQLVRRIDWRFLLPESQLRRVAYLGPNDGTLLSALREFCDSLEIISSTAGVEKNPPLCNLAVVRSCSLADLARAHARLVAGGYLYWEIDRRNWLTILRTMSKRDSCFQAKPSAKQNGGLNGALHYFRDCVVALEGLGFGEIEINWHRPNFEACLEIIPLHEPRALDYVFSRPRNGFVSHLQLTAGKYMVKTGLLFRLAPCVSLIAKRIFNTEKTESTEFTKL